MDTLEQILGPQQRLVIDKAKSMLASKDRAVHDDALVEARRLVGGVLIEKT